MKILTILVTFLLVAASGTQLPPSLSKIVASLHDPNDVASIYYSAPTSMIPGSTDSYLVILKGSDSLEYQLITTIRCVAVETEQIWECSQKKKWRISGPYDVFVEGIDGTDEWIAKDPEKALTPYIAMLESIPDQFARDRFDAPPSTIYISNDGARLIYSRYGSGCTTTYGIKSTWLGDRLTMQLDTLNEKAFCI